jgi:hypothetical protein
MACHEDKIKAHIKSWPLNLHQAAGCVVNSRTSEPNGCTSTRKTGLTLLFVTFWDFGGTFCFLTREKTSKRIQLMAVVETYKLHNRSIAFIQRGINPITETKRWSRIVCKKWWGEKNKITNHNKSNEQEILYSTYRSQS